MSAAALPPGATSRSDTAPRRAMSLPRKYDTEGRINRSREQTFVRQPKYSKQDVNGYVANGQPPLHDQDPYVQPSRKAAGSAGGGPLKRSSSFRSLKKFMVRMSRGSSHKKRDYTFQENETHRDEQDYRFKDRDRSSLPPIQPPQDGRKFSRDRDDSPKLEPRRVPLSQVDLSSQGSLSNYDAGSMEERTEQSRHANPARSAFHPAYRPTRISPTSPSGPTPATCGIYNHGSTCYMSAVLQCLSNTDVLAEYLVMGGFRWDINPMSVKSKKFGTEGELTFELASLIRGLWLHQYSKSVSQAFQHAVELWSKVRFLAIFACRRLHTMPVYLQYVHMYSAC